MSRLVFSRSEWENVAAGNSKTSLIVACSPHLDNIEETISTLKFAERAKTIKNKVRRRRRCCCCCTVVALASESLDIFLALLLQETHVHQVWLRLACEQVTLNETKSVAELEAIVKTLSRELEQLRTYCGAIEEALTKAGVDPKSVAVPKGGAVAAGKPSLDSKQEFREAMELKTELKKLNDVLKIAQEDVEESRKAATESTQAAEAAMAEGGAAKAEMEQMAVQREKERQLAVKAIGELKKMHAKNSQQAQQLKQAGAKEKELNNALKAEKATGSQLSADLASKSDACAQAESKLRAIEQKFDALQGQEGGSGGGDGDGILAIIDANQKELEETQRNLSEAKNETRQAREAMSAKADEDGRMIKDLNGQIESGKLQMKEVEEAHNKAISVLEAEKKGLEEQTRDLNLQVASLSKAIEELTAGAERMRDDHREATDKLVDDHTTALQGMRSELVQTQAAADEAASNATEAAQAQDKAFAELEQSSTAALEAEREAHEGSKKMHEEQVSNLQAEHSAAVTALNAEATAQLDAEKAAHAKSVEEAAAAADKAATEHADTVARLNAERDSQLEAAGASQSEAAQQMASLQDSHQKAVEELSAQHEKALSDSQEQHASAVEALQSEAEQLKQGHAEQIETIQSEHAEALKDLHGKMEQAQKEAEEAASASRTDHATQIAELNAQMEEKLEAGDVQFKEAMEIEFAAQETLKEEHASAIATVEAELTDKLNAESAAHGETKKRLEASMASATAEHEAGTATAEKRHTAEFDAMKAAHQTEIETLSSEQEALGVAHTAALEKLNSEHATLMADTETRHEAAIAALREELAALRSKADEDIANTTARLKSEMGAQLEAAGASQSDAAQALSRQHEAAAATAAQLEADFRRQSDEAAAQHAATLAEARAEHQSETEAQSLKFEQEVAAVKDEAAKELERVNTDLAQKEQELLSLQSILNVTEVAAAQLNEVQEELMRESLRSKSLAKELRRAEEDLENFILDDEKAESAEQKLAEKDAEIRALISQQSDKDKVLASKEDEITEWQNKARKLRDESLPDEVASVFDAVVKAQASSQFGAAIRLLDHGVEQTYDVMDDLEERGDKKSHDKVERSYNFYDKEVRASLKEAYNTAPEVEWESAEMLPDEATLAFARAAVCGIDDADGARQLYQDAFAVARAKIELADAARQQLMEVALTSFQHQFEVLQGGGGDGGDSNRLTLSVTVPSGLVAGDVIGVATEWGEIEVEIPEGLESGDEFDVQLALEDEAEPAPEAEPLPPAPHSAADTPGERSRRPSVSLRGSFSRGSFSRSAELSQAAISEGVPP
jgi:hypothetical protein